MLEAIRTKNSADGGKSKRVQKSGRKILQTAEGPTVQKSERKILQTAECPTG